jgi:hypothetical protein
MRKKVVYREPFNTITVSNFRLVCLEVVFRFRYVLDLIIGQHDL